MHSSGEVLAAVWCTALAVMAAVPIAPLWCSTGCSLVHRTFAVMAAVPNAPHWCNTGCNLVHSTVAVMTEAGDCGHQDNNLPQMH